MLDLHTHALPELDDGAKSLAESVKMIRECIFQGVRICVLTPHCVIHYPGDIEKFIEKRQVSFEKINNEFKSTDIDFVLGAEVCADHDVSRHEDIFKLCMGDTGCILLELVPAHKPSWLENCIYNLNMRGITVVFAHIDRYPYRESIIRELKGLDVIYQINASRFLSFSGRRIIKRLLSYREKFVVSSDMHNMTTRKCNMRKAKKISDKKFKNRALFAQNFDELNKKF